MGDGLADLVSVDAQLKEVVWMENLGEARFGPIRRIRNTREIPPFHSGDAWSLNLLADMTGDGRADIVHIKPGQSTYWQNLSYGRFGKQVIMYGAPHFEPESFSPYRIRLADINGSGTSDLLYFPPSGGLHVHLNHAGNGSSKPQVLRSFPKDGWVEQYLHPGSVWSGNVLFMLDWPSPRLALPERLILHRFVTGHQAKLLDRVFKWPGSSS